MCTWSPEAAADVIAVLFLLRWFELVNSSLLVMSLTCFLFLFWSEIFHEQFHFVDFIHYINYFPHDFCKQYLASNYFVNGSVISITFFHVLLGSMPVCQTAQNINSLLHLRLAKCKLYCDITVFAARQQEGDLQFLKWTNFLKSVNFEIFTV